MIQLVIAAPTKDRSGENWLEQKWTANKPYKLWTYCCRVMPMAWAISGLATWSRFHNDQTNSLSALHCASSSCRRA